MSLFGGPTRPKGITKEELMFVRSELANASFGHGAEKLNTMQLDDIMEDLAQAMDPDTRDDITHHWSQVSNAEAQEIEAAAANGKGLKYSPAQVAHIKKVFDKYLQINRTKSFF